MTEFFAAPNGSPSGNGTIGSPWNLDLALGSYDSSGSRVSSPASIHPGDTVWLRGGTYVPNSDNGFFAHITSSDPAKPVIVRNYNGERATIQCGTHAFCLSAEAPNVWYWGIEICCFGAPRVTNEAGGANPLSYGFRAMASGVKLINCVVHDTAQGLSGYNASPDSEFHGNLSYYNGWRGSDRPHGHGVYMQNATGTKTIENNVVFDNSDEGLQIYGSGGAMITGLTIRRNSVANSGSTGGDGQFKYNFILGGGQLNTLNNVEENDFFFSPDHVGDSGGGYLNFGQYTKSTNNKFKKNNIVGGNICFACEGAYGPMEVTDNQIYTLASQTLLVALAQTAGDNLSQFTWDRNKYYGKQAFRSGEYYQDPASGNFSTRNAGLVNFAGWKTGTGFDANGSYNATPTGKWIRVSPNKYEQKRANITIYNWDLSPAVEVDLSGVLGVGDQFVIQDAQNFYGSPVVAGTYAGPVSVPMAGLVKAPSVGFGTPSHTAPLFGTFVVMQPGASNPINGVVINPVSVTVQVGTTKQFTANLIGLTGGVTWSTTQGSISASGLYTAPSVAGSYVVTAASMSDPSKSASATVSVTLAAPVPPPIGAPMNTGDYVINHNPGATTGCRVDYDSSLPKIANIADNAIGLILDGPKPDKSTGGFTFYKVKWQAGEIGWSVDGYLRATSPTVPPIDPGTYPVPIPVPVPVPTSHAANLTWDPVSTADAGYCVYRNGVKIATVTTPGYVDHTVAANSSYTYTVRTEASATGSQSMDSNFVMANIPADSTTPPPPPPSLPQHAAPTNLTVTVS